MAIIIDRSKNHVNMDYSYTPPDKPRYPANDLGSVYSHWSPELHKNIITENKINGGATNNGKSS
jgi:hypothetical protein